MYDRPDAFAFSIDPEVCDVGIGNILYFGMIKRFVRVLGKSQDVGLHWRYEIDAAYIDGDHSYEACARDIELWVPWVKEGGLIFFHDYGTPHTPGVVRAVDETMGGFEYLGKDLDTPKGVLVAYRK